MNRNITIGFLILTIIGFAFYQVGETKRQERLYWAFIAWSKETGNVNSLTFVQWSALYGGKIK